jgi:peptidyl-prolyl cis-trans isomerase C
MLKNLPPTEKTFFLKQLEMKKTSLEAYKDKISKDKKSQDAFAINQWIKKNIEPKLKIGDAEVKKYYDEHKDFFKKPETIQASHILIKAESEKPEDLAKAKKKADELLARLKKGEDFAELAKKESACPSGAKGGDLGEFARGTMVPQFEQVAFTLKPGELSNVVETKFGCHLIKGGQKNEGKTYELDDKVKKYIEMRLKSEKEVQELEKTLKAEKDKLGVKLEI